MRLDSPVNRVLAMSRRRVSELFAAYGSDVGAAAACRLSGKLARSSASSRRASSSSNRTMTSGPRSPGAGVLWGRVVPPGC